MKTTMNQWSKETRIKKIKHRRNFLPTFIVNVILWISWFLIIFFLSPNKTFHFSPALPAGRLFTFNFIIPINIILFFTTFTLSLTLTMAFIMANTRRGFLLSLFLSITLLFRLLKICHWWNILIVFLLASFAEFWFWKKPSPKKRKALLLKF